MNAQASFVSYDAERGNIDASLNFVVPASIMTGLLRFTVDVASPVRALRGQHSVGRDAGRRQPDADTQRGVHYYRLQRQWNNANTTTLNLPAPTLAQCQTETSWAMTTYPLSGTPNVRLAGTFVTTTPLNDPRSCPGCCSPNWQPLLQQVAALVALDLEAGNPGTWVYYGIVNSGIPVNVPGCNGWVVTGGLAGQPVTYAHEIGHQFGLPHARCGNAGNGNANYPVFEPYDLPVDPPNTANWTMASIGEYGVDINNGNIANPNDSEDFMSYCGPRWISLDTHTFLINAAGLTPQVIPTGSGAAASRVIRDESSPFERNETHCRTARLSAWHHRRGRQGRGRDGGEAADPISSWTWTTDPLCSPVARRKRQGPIPGHRVRLSIGRLPLGALRRVLVRGERSAADLVQDETPNDVAPGASLRILKGNEVVWERARPDTPPRLERWQPPLSMKRGS